MRYYSLKGVAARYASELLERPDAFLWTTTIPVARVLPRAGDAFVAFSVALATHFWDEPETPSSSSLGASST